MKIDQQQYDRVLALATALTTAVENDNDKDYLFQYSLLEKFCHEARNAGTAHPFLLESLGDFTLLDDEAIDIYEEALDLAEKCKLPEYRASLQLAIAERYHELGDLEAALSYASEAQKNLQYADEQGLREELAEFMLTVRGST
jgi:tetratricopeptide (TPR) repeat protein